MRSFVSFREGDSHHSAQQRAYRYIRDRIVEGAIPGGTKLNSADVAEILGISRMPVREAIVQLDAEGLVTNRPNRGAIVTPLEPDDIEELFEMRAALEGLAARRAALLCTEAQLEELTAIAERMDRVAKDVQQWLRMHDMFHDFLCSIAQRPRLEAEARRIRASVHPYLMIFNQAFGRMEMEGAEHLALVSALRSHNATLAERALSHHISTAASGVIQFLRERREVKAAG